MENTKNLIKIGFGKIISGFLLGIGFGISFFIIALIATNYVSKKIEEYPPYSTDVPSDISTYLT